MLTADDDMAYLNAQKFYFNCHFWNVMNQIIRYQFKSIQNFNFKL